MDERGKAKAAAGMLLAALGLIALATGLSRAAWLPGVGTFPGWGIATVVGFVLLTGGSLAWVFSVQRPPEPVPAVSATEAFAQKTSRLHPMLEAEAQAPPPRPRAPAPRSGLDTEIRELTRQISRAGVLLATGQLSQEGYKRYVEDLKRRRGELEAERVRLELQGKAPP